MLGGAATFAVNRALEFVSPDSVGADAQDGDPSTRLAMAILGRRFSGSLRRGIAPHSTCDGVVPSTLYDPLKNSKGNVKEDTTSKLLGLGKTLF